MCNEPRHRWIRGVATASAIAAIAAAFGGGCDGPSSSTPPAASASASSVWTPEVSFVQLFHATSSGETVWSVQRCGEDGTSFCPLTRRCTNYDCSAVVELTAAAVEGLRQGLAKDLTPVEPGPDAGCSTEMGFIGMLTQSVVVADGAVETVYGRYGSQDLPACVSFEESDIRRDSGIDDDEVLLTGPFDGYFTAASYDTFEDELEGYLQYCESADGADDAGICGPGGVGP